MTHEPDPSPQILLVDDNATNLQVLYQTLDGHGYRLLAARSGKDALGIAQRIRPDLILLDVMMPEMDGFETCARLKADDRTCDIAILFLSALTEAGEKARGLDLGAVDFINKPFHAEEVLARVRTHLTIRDLQRQLQRRNDELAHELSVARELLREARDRGDGVLVGQSPAAVRLRDAIRDAGANDEALLISGPPGSDHEAIARAVHHHSTRSRRAIIAITGAAFGQPAPSFAETGASVDLGDRLRLAEGGTLYIEGIQHLPRSLQRQLTEVIDRQDAARRSGATPDPDVRVIGATTRNVDDEVDAGRLTPELRRAFPRTLDVVPLRERLEDLPALAGHILRRQADVAGRTVPIITEASMERLRRYRWPGNVRELGNVLGAALAASEGPLLDIGDHLLDNNVRIGNYTLLERLGSGGMGEVWLARHRLLARPAAVKLVRESALALGEDGRVVRQRFAREAHATAGLQSPHTVQLFDFGVTDTGGFYYVMERLHGLDLQRLVERHGALPEERAIALLKQACLSLAEAHAAGLVHRDVKPANLFVCRLGREYDFLKVLDFGVVARHGRGQNDPITLSGMILGTPAFLAPELVGGRQAFDARADIYALGCVAYWMLTGAAPFEAPDTITLLMHHARTPPTAPSARNQGANSTALDELVLACLAKTPEQRPSSAEVLCEALDAVALARPWDQRRARAWWEQHEPTTPKDGTADPTT